MSSLEAVLPRLEQLFGVQRVVFWHDPDSEYAEEVDSLDLPGVNLIRVAGDEFGVKSTILADHVTKHLVYRTGAVAGGTGNWLLDLELAYGVFTADRTSLLQQELDLADPTVASVLEQHRKFFAAQSRTQSLEKLLATDDDADLLRAKMCQVLVRSSGHMLVDILRELLTENAERRTAKYDELVSYGLATFLWDGLHRIYLYSAETPTIDDFVLWMFARAFHGFTGETATTYRNIRNDFTMLRYDMRTQEMMATLAGRAGEALDIPARIADSDYRDLLDSTVFEEVDRAIIVGLAADVATRAVTRRDVAETVRRRRENSPWYGRFAEIYEAIDSAAQLFAALRRLPASIASLEAGLEGYRTEWFRIDQHYRHFIHAYRTAEYQQPLTALKGEVDKQYTHRYLYPLGGLWQQAIDGLERWRSDALPSQASFYRDHIAPLIADGRTKAVVIISDGLRYEIADELASRIRSEDRFDADLSAMLGVLPSYTQLGMASLLPHEELEVAAEGMPVLADGKPTDGTTNRDKILQAVDGHVMTAKAVLDMGRDELREVYKAHRVFYVYHNLVDAAGDDATTERTVFEAAEDAMEELVLLVKKWTNANATNIVITADHGFLYQDVPLEEPYYLSEKARGDAVTKTNRRYVLGRSLAPSPSYLTFTSAQVGLSGDIDIQIPKSIHRIPLPGAGTRYVHGGASLQEVVVPVIVVNKKRKSDVRQVQVDLIRETDKITTGQLTVKLLQREPVTDKTQARQIRVGLYVGDTLISDQPTVTCDSTSSDQRDRYRTVTLYLTRDADEFNNRSTELRLKEPIPNTSRWKAFAKANYTIKRSFTTDFDF